MQSPRFEKMDAALVLSLRWMAARVWQVGRPIIDVRSGCRNVVATLLGEMFCMAMNRERAKALEGKK